MGQDTSQMSEMELHRERLQAREALAHDVELLEEKLSPSAIMERRKARWSRWLRQRQHQVSEQMEETVESLGQSVQGVGGSVQHMGRSTARMARERTYQMPLAVGAGFFALGWAISRLIPMSRSESQMLSQVNQTVTEKASPIVEEAKTAVSESTKEAIAHR